MKRKVLSCVIIYVGIAILEKVMKKLVFYGLLLFCGSCVLLFSQENNKDEVLFNSSFVELWSKPTELSGTIDFIFSPDNKYLFRSRSSFSSTKDTNIICKYDAQTGELLKIYSHFFGEEEVNFQVSKKYNYLITYGNGLKIMDIDSDSILYEFKGINDRDWIGAVMLTENDSLMFFNRAMHAGWAKDYIVDSIYCMRLSDFKIIKKIGEKRDKQYLQPEYSFDILGFSADLKYLFIFSRDYMQETTIKILKYDAEKESIIDTLKTQFGNNVFSKNGKLFISQPDNTLFWIDCNSKEKMVKNYITDSNWKLQYPYNTIRFDGEEKYLFVATNKGTERIYSIETMELLLEKPKIYFASNFNVKEMSSDNSMLVDAIKDPRFIIYSMDPDSILSSLQTTNIQTKINIQNDNLIIPKNLKYDK